MGGGGDLDSSAWGGSSSNKWIAGFLTRRTILVGGFNPSEKYESQWEGLSHILWKIKNVPNHQSASCLTWGCVKPNSTPGEPQVIAGLKWM